MKRLTLGVCLFLISAGLAYAREPVKPEFIGTTVQVAAGTDAVQAGVLSTSYFAAIQNGATAGDQVNTTLGLLPGTGGTVYANFQGTQALTALSFSGITKPVVLEFGAGATYTLGASLTVPSNVTLKFAQGSIISVSNTFTLTIQGNIDAPLTQIFTGAGTVIIPSTKVSAIYPQWWGAVGDGSTNDAAAFQSAATALSNGGVIQIVHGNYKLLNKFTPLANTTIRGDGVGLSKLTVIASAIRHLPAISVTHDNISIRDLTVSMDPSTGGTVRGIQFDAASSNIRVENTEFIGTGPTALCFALTISGYNVTNLYVSKSLFTDVSFVIIKDNSDTSVTTNTVFDTVRVTNTASGINVNNPLDPSVVGKVRGSWTDITVTNSYFDTMSTTGGWGVGLSGLGVKRASITNSTFINSTQEQIHIEDGASDISIVGNRFYKKGTNAAGAGRGLVHIIGGPSGGSNHVTVATNVFDLTDSAGGNNGFGLDAQAGGAYAAPHHLEIIGNTFKMKSGNPGVIIADAYAVKLSNTYDNVLAASKAAYAVNIGRSKVDAFHESFYNPGALYWVDDNSFGVITKPSISGDLSTSVAFDFLTNNANGSTGVLFNGFTLTRSYTAGAAHGATTALFPAGTLFDGVVGLRFQQNGTSLTWVATAKVKYDGTKLTAPLSELQSFSGLSRGNISSVLTLTGSDVTATSSGAGEGTIVVNFDGQYFP